MNKIEDYGFIKVSDIEYVKEDENIKITLLFKNTVKELEITKLHKSSGTISKTIIGYDFLRILEFIAEAQRFKTLTKSNGISETITFEELVESENINNENEESNN